MDLSYLIYLQYELLLAGIILILLVLKIDGRASNVTIIRVTQVLLFAGLLLNFGPLIAAQMFNGMFRVTPLLTLEKSLLLLATLIISLSSYEWLKKHEHLPEFYILLLSSLLGLFFLVSSGNLLMFYLALELSTIPLAALCNFDLGKKISSEAALKMILSSAFSSAILLFGISLIYGATGSLDFQTIGASLTPTKLEVFAFILIFTGFAFKLSVVPFHLWTADVYEGSPVAVTAFLSVVSKGAFAFIFITTLYRVFGSMGPIWYKMLAFSAVITMITGNLFALRQQNLKRFMAFSSIAQMGYLLIGISAVTMLGVTSVVYFILVYIFSNLAVFGVISVVSSATGKETIDDFRGLYSSNPALALVMALGLFSLAGIPPTAGFFGKLFLLTAGARQYNWPLIIIASLNLVISLYYYLRIIRAMFVETSPEPLPALGFTWSAKTAFAICGIGILSVGFIKSLFDAIYVVSANF